MKSVHHTIVGKGIANVEIFGSGDKRLIAATFVVTSDGRDLSMQLICDGKTTRSMPFVDFPSFFSLSANPKHFPNTDGSVKVIKKTLVSYFESQKRELRLDKKSPALLILDALWGQMTQEDTSLLTKKNILFVKILYNIKHLLLPLNVLINDWIKQCMSQRFADWYAEQIWADLEKGSELENTEVKMTLAVMKNFMLDYCTKN